MTSNNLPQQILNDGYVTIENVYSKSEITSILKTINDADGNSINFRKNADIFAIRRFLYEVPAVANLILTSRLITIIQQLFGSDYFLVKSIYFNKPGQSNWFVSYHQDLGISVDKKISTEGYSHWTIKENQFSVQPPVELLENNFTIRIHLDDTNEFNGALKVIPGSHLKGIRKYATLKDKMNKEVSCNVKKGGIMIMKPLLFHSSNRSLSANQRRIIHLEFSNSLLPGRLQWAEYMSLKNNQAQ